MKSRALASAIAILLSASLALPSFAQSTSQSQAPADPPDQSQSLPNATQNVATPADSVADTSPTASAPKETHNKDKNDIDNIGDRKVGSGGKSLGDWYSLDTDIKMGKQYAMMVEQSAKMVKDPVIVEYVNRIGQNLVRNSDAKVPFTIKVVDSDDINAFALPGGFFYVNSGLVLAADDEAELAGVMAHEIAHVAARHATREMTRANYANLATIPLIFVGNWGIYEAASMALNLALPLTFMKFSRGFEAEADYLGLQYMYKAGYDPQAFISFFEKIQAQEKKKPGTLARAFASHPPTPDRILKSQEEIRSVLPPRPEYIVNTSEFNDVKARLATLENRKKVIDKQDVDKPSLRKTQTADSTPGQPKDQQGDEPPTLSRRDDYVAGSGR
ncbi:MAG: M48 family metalloprotease [Acidobacteriota bacterium]|nr:M48 family metalloprotease [Acidobacteriota bacterium]